MHAQATRGHRPLAFVLLDIDYFKRLNDTWGHDAGDRALAAVGEALSSHLRDSDLAARSGGEEFAVLLPDTPVEGALRVAEELRGAIAEIDLGLERTTMTASFGVAVLGLHADDPHALMQAADRALYAAKRGGRDRVEVAAATQPLAPAPPARRAGADGELGRAQRSPLLLRDRDQRQRVVADDPVDAEVDRALDHGRVVERVRDDLQPARVQPGDVRPVEVGRVGADVPVVVRSQRLVGVVDLPVGRDGAGACAADQLAEVLVAPPVEAGRPRALHLRVAEDRLQRALVGERDAFGRPVLPHQRDRLARAGRACARRRSCASRTTARWRGRAGRHDAARRRAGARARAARRPRTAPAARSSSRR